MLLPRDKVFIAAAKRLGLLADPQIKVCLGVLAERRALGIDKDLGEVALDKGFIDAAGLKKIQKLAQTAQQAERGAAATGPGPTAAPPVGPAATRPAAAAPPQAGTASADLIENYQILGKVGEGASASVYRARHRVLEKEVALKILSSELTRSEDYVARFLREARAAAKIDHPNLVRIHDAGESNGRHFIAMELVEGLNLEKLLARDGPLSELATLEVGREIAKALDAAFGARIVHRDVKPENMIRTPDGRFKLLDLGLARGSKGEPKGQGSITDHGTTLGTPYFVSPEQARGEELDTRSDLYSLGVTLFYLATGEHPFTGTAAPDVMRRHITDPVPSPRVLRPSLSGAFDALVQKLMAKEPKRRYQSPQELIQTLELILSGDVAAVAAPAPEPKRVRDSGERKAAAPRGRAPRPAPAAKQGGAAPAAAAAHPEPVEGRSTQALLAYAAGGLAVVLVALIIILNGMKPIEVADAELARQDERSPSRARGAATGGGARGQTTGGGATQSPSGAVPAFDIEAEAKIYGQRFAEDLRHMNELERGGDYAKARELMDRVIRGYAGPRERERALQEIARLREAEQEARKRVVSLPDQKVPVKPAFEEEKPVVEPDPFGDMAAGSSSSTPSGTRPAPEPSGDPSADPFGEGASGTPAPDPVVKPRVEPVPVPPPTPAPEPEPAPAVEPPKTKFGRLFAFLLKGTVTTERDRTVTAAYRLAKGCEPELRDWEVVKPPSRARCEADGLMIEAVGRAGRYRHMVTFTTPFEMTAVVQLGEGAQAAGARFTLYFGDLKAGMDYAVATDLSLAKRKSGEAIKVYKKPAAKSVLEPGRAVKLAIKVGDDGVSLFVDGKPVFEKVAIAEGEGQGLLGFEAEGGPIVIKELKVGGAPDPVWLVDALKKLPPE